MGVPFCRVLPFIFVLGAPIAFAQDRGAIFQFSAAQADFGVKSFDRPGFFPVLSAVAIERDEGIPTQLPLLTTRASDGSFTLEAFLYIRDVAGIQTIFSNDRDREGITLRLEDNKIVAFLNLSDHGNVNRFRVEGGKLEPDTWVRISLRGEETGGHFKAHLFLNGKQIMAATCLACTRLLQSMEDPVIGSDLREQYRFKGLISKIIVLNYAADIDGYLALNLTAQDGSPTLGLPQYIPNIEGLDDLPATVDQKISATIHRYSDEEKILSRLPLPFLNDHYVPQGIFKDEEYVYVSMQHQDPQAGKNKKPSIVARMKLDGSLWRVYSLHWDLGLPYTGKVGGIAVVGDALYLPAGDRIARFELKTGDVLYNVAHSSWLTDATRMLETVRNEVLSLGSTVQQQGPALKWFVTSVYMNHALDMPVVGGDTYLSLSQDHDGKLIAWTGAPDSKTPILQGFRFEPDGSLSREPLYRMVLSQNLPGLQSVALKAANADHFEFYLSQSDRDRSSKIFSFKIRRGADRSLASSEGLKKVYEGPAGLRDLFFDPSEKVLWGVSASGARVYQENQNRAQVWNDLYPFAFAWKP